MISTNPGEQLRPLSEIASGGELSRIMLALKTVFADQDDIASLIFDEIDTGISGVTAWKVSEKLGKLAASHQIICITHLPQIAAMYDRHFLIQKGLSDSRTITSISRLSDDESIDELGRMLGAGEVTDAVRQNAREMRNKALKTKA
jgi:DNA repair protein RecN (Recombination protein N)